MANDIGVHSLGGAVPVSRKDNANPTKDLQPGRPLAAKADAEQQSASRLAEQPQRAELEQSVENLNSLVQELQRELRFSVDDDSGEMIVKVVDRQTDEVVRQIPSEEILKLRERLEAATGAIFQDKA